MGIIQAVKNAVGGAFADQFLESVEPSAELGHTAIMVPGVKVRNNSNRNSNINGTDNVVSNGSLIHVYPGTMMILVDGGKIIAATCQEGYYQVSDAAAPSLFAGELGDALKNTFERVKFGGGTPRSQRVYYINLQEIRDITYGTENPLNYFDPMYKAEVFIRAHGTYSIKIIDPLKFYTEVAAKGDVIANRVIDFNDIKRQFNGEFLTALRDSMSKMSAAGFSFAQMQSNTENLTKYMDNALDETWNVLRGIVIVKTTISASYDEDTEKLVKARTEGMMLGDQQVMSGYMAKNVAEGIKAAGSNESGAVNSFLGMGMGMNMAGNIMQGLQQPMQSGYQAQPQNQQNVNAWKCQCGAENTGKFCQQCGKPKPAQQSADSWICVCGTVNSGNFCQECGKPKPTKVKCAKCGYEPPEGQNSKFCPNCGTKL